MKQYQIVGHGLSVFAAVILAFAGSGWQDFGKVIASIPDPPSVVR